ncbi:MAG: hypothetical protein ACRDIU_10790 [Actinomycetota bacterium]
MKRRFARDLRRWEEGEITSSLLEARYPRHGVDDLTDLFAQMRTLVDDPVADMVPSWNEIRSTMASRRQAAPPSLLQKLSPGLHRRLALGVAAAVLAIPPMAFAATNDSVRDSVGSFVDNVTVFVMGEDEIAADTAGDTSLDAPAGGDTESAGSAGSSGGSTSTKSSTQTGGAAKSSPPVAGTSGASTSDSGTSGSGGTAGAAGTDASGTGAQPPAAAPGPDGASVPAAPAAPAPAPAPVEPAPSPSASPTAAPQP